MKRFVTSILVGSVIASSTAVPLVKVEAAVTKKVNQPSKSSWIVNGMNASLHTVDYQGKQLVAVKDLFNVLNSSYSYNSKTKAVKGTKTVNGSKTNILLTVGNPSFHVNGEKGKLTVAPKMIQGAVYVEAAPIVQALGKNYMYSIGKTNLISVEKPIQLSQVSYLKDGITSKSRALTMNKVTLFSVKDVATSLGAKLKFDAKTQTVTLSKGKWTATFQALKDEIKLNGHVTKATNVPFVYKNVFYAHPADIVQALGGELSVEPDNKWFVASEGFVRGSVFDAQWLNEDSILVTHDQEQATTKIMNVQTKKVIHEFKEDELTVSPNGRQAAYTDEDGYIHVVDLSSYKDRILNDNDEIKVELTWSKDSNRLYYINGKDNENISMVRVSDGAITKLLEDKLKYKSDLRLSNDESTVIYTASKEAETSYTDDDKTDVGSIDTSGTEPQLYKVDLHATEKKAIKLTTTKDNKMFSFFDSKGNVGYVSFDLEDEKKLPTLKLMVNGKVKNVLSGKSIQFISRQENALYVVIKEKGWNYVCTFNSANSSLNKMVSVKEDITAISVSKDKKQLLLSLSTDQGEKVAVVRNQRVADITK
ncbi:copper amine oxidase N-terminal domain-containing protein [Priestia koreensis]|uniref:Copper amine oxidase-like N-terminal domain-containing protein n=1 Tax=Priestia koreensis TaxID=284581 RepID=A0A0M0L6S4_9BACI|nr:copper amine oxidase N-terminal domain-containing protein [Priestia koreensis]KOO46776.1 hypothetical protein AMD01_07555 [Priestia koreensis]